MKKSHPFVYSILIISTEVFRNIKQIHNTMKSKYSLHISLGYCRSFKPPVDTLIFSGIFLINCILGWTKERVCRYSERLLYKRIGSMVRISIKDNRRLSQIKVKGSRIEEIVKLRLLKFTVIPICCDTYFSVPGG